MTPAELKRLNRAFKIIGYALGTIDAALFYISEQRDRFQLIEARQQIEDDADELIKEILDD